MNDENDITIDSDDNNEKIDHDNATDSSKVIVSIAIKANIDKLKTLKRNISCKARRSFLLLLLRLPVTLHHMHAVHSFIITNNNIHVRPPKLAPLLQGCCGDCQAPRPASAQPEIISDVRRGLIYDSFNQAGA
eukprot:scaffold465630_cov18-Prasinocladus_malaysianus.AAC.1